MAVHSLDPTRDPDGVKVRLRRKWLIIAVPTTAPADNAEPVRDWASPVVAGGRDVTYWYFIEVARKKEQSDVQTAV